MRFPEGRKLRLEFPDAALPPEGGRDAGKEPDQNPGTERDDDDHQDGSAPGVMEETDRDDSRVLDREDGNQPHEEDKEYQNDPHGERQYITGTRDEI